jgi:hypothetical protein
MRRGSGSAGSSCGWLSWSGGWEWTVPTRGLLLPRNGPGRRSPGGPGSSRNGSGARARRGGQPGHQGKGPQRHPDPGERKDAPPPAECRRCGAGLDEAEPAGESRWAQVIDVKAVRTVTEWLLPGLSCPCCGTVTFAEPPPGAHAGAVSYGAALNAAAVVLTAYGNVPPERAARVIGMLLGHRSPPAGWTKRPPCKRRIAYTSGRAPEMPPDGHQQPVITTTGTR